MRRTQLLIQSRIAMEYCDKILAKEVNCWNTTTDPAQRENPKGIAKEQGNG